MKKYIPLIVAFCAFVFVGKVNADTDPYGPDSYYAKTCTKVYTEFDQNMPVGFGWDAFLTGYEEYNDCVSGECSNDIYDANNFYDTKVAPAYQNPSSFTVEELINISNNSLDYATMLNGHYQKIKSGADAASNIATRCEGIKNTLVFQKSEMVRNNIPVPASLNSLISKIETFTTTMSGYQEDMENFSILEIKDLIDLLLAKAKLIEDYVALKLDSGFNYANPSQYIFL